MLRTATGVLAGCALLGAVAAGPAAAGSGGPTEVDVNTAGVRANQDSGFPAAVSAGGRYVLFTSTANNLDPRQRYRRHPYLYLRDRQAGTTQVVSVSSTGVPGFEDEAEFGDNAAVTPDGRYVVFASSDHRIDPAKRTGWIDVYRHDMVTGRTLLVSVSSTGGAANGNSGTASVSADGQQVVFSSIATNLVPQGGSSRIAALFVRDLRTGRTSRVNTSSDGQVVPGGARVTNHAISGDGSFVVYSAPAETSDPGRVHLHVLATGRDTVISVDQAGRPAGDSGGAEASADSRYVQFSSTAALAPGGTAGTTLLYRRTVSTGATVLASVLPHHKNGYCNFGFLSPTGRYSTYHCYSTHATYRRDLDTGQVTRVDLNDAGQPGNEISFPLGITATGHVVFATRSTNIGGGGYIQHVYVR